MGTLVALVLEDYRVNGRKTAWRVEDSYLHLAPHFDVYPLRDFPQKVAAYVTMRTNEGAKPGTIQNELAHLHKGLTMAHRQGLLDVIPYIPRLSVRNARQGFVDEEQFACIRLRLPHPLDWAAYFAYVSGWRRCEVFGLTWDRLDMARGIARLEVGTTKNGEGRVFPFGAHKGLLELFTRLSGDRRGPFVFHRHGKPVKSIKVAWRSACLGAGCKGVLFHDLRRSAVRNYERAGVPRSVAMKLTGHLTESVYRRYAVCNERDLAEGVSRLK